MTRFAFVSTEAIYFEICNSLSLPANLAKATVGTSSPLLAWRRGRRKQSDAPGLECRPGSGGSVKATANTHTPLAFSVAGPDRLVSRVGVVISGVEDAVRHQHDCLDQLAFLHSAIGIGLTDAAPHTAPVVRDQVPAPLRAEMTGGIAVGRERPNLRNQCITIVGEGNQPCRRAEVGVVREPSVGSMSLAPSARTLKTPAAGEASVYL